MSNSKDQPNQDQANSASDATSQDQALSTLQTSRQPTQSTFEEVLEQSLQTTEPILPSTEPSPEPEKPSQIDQKDRPVPTPEELGPEDFPTDLDEHWNEIPTETAEWHAESDTNPPSFVLEEIESSKGLEEWGQLHPYSLLINLLPQMARTIQNAWPLLLFIVVGGNQANQVIDSIFVLFFVALSVLRTLIHFLTLRYKVQDGKLVVKMGLIFRQARTLDPERIQNMEITQNLLHKYFDLVELKLETAGDASTKGLLSALSREDATRLKTALQYSKRRSQTPTSIEETPSSLSLSWGEVLLFGLSRRTVGTVVVLSAVVSESMSVVSPDQAQYVASSMNLQLFIGLMAISFAASWIWSSLQATLRYHKLQLKVLPDDISIVSGLITKRSVEIPRHKIQTIEWFEPWLRRQMGFGTLYLETAALGMADGEVRRSEGIVPMVERSDLSSILEQIAPTSSREILAADTHSPHANARYLIVFGYLFPATLSVVGAWWMFEPSMLSLTLISILALVVVLGLTELDFQMQRWTITPHAILAREGYLNRRTTIVDREKVQSVYRAENPILKALGLSQVIIRVAGAVVHLPLIPESTAAEVLDNLAEDWR